MLPFWKHTLQTQARSQASIQPYSKQPQHMLLQDYVPLPTAEQGDRRQLQAAKW